MYLQDKVQNEKESRMNEILVTKPRLYKQQTFSSVNIVDGQECDGRKLQTKTSSVELDFVNVGVDHRGLLFVSLWDREVFLEVVEVDGGDLGPVYLLLIFATDNRVPQPTHKGHLFSFPLQFIFKNSRVKYWMCLLCSVAFCLCCPFSVVRF